MTQYDEHPWAQSLYFLNFFLFLFLCSNIIEFLSNDIAPTSDLTAFFAVFGGFFVIFGAIFVLKWALRKDGIREIEQCKRDLLIGFGGIVVSSLIPRIGLSVVEYNRVMLIPLVILPVIAMLLFYYQFIFNRGRIIESLNYDFSFSRCIKTIVGSLILMIAQLKYNGIYLEISSQIICTNLLQILFAIPSTASAIDFLTVLANEFDMRSAESRAIMDSGAHIKPKISAETSLPFTHDVTMFCYMFLAGSLTFAALFIQFFIGAAEFNWPSLIAFGVGIISLVKMLKKSVLGCFERNETTKNEQCEINSMIGLAGSLSIGFCGSIGVFFEEINAAAISFIIFITLITSISLYYHFILGFRKTHNLDYVNNENSILIVILIDIILFFISIKIGICYEDQIAQKVICVTQLFFFALTTSSSVDLAVVLMGGVYLKKGNGKLVQTNTVVRQVPVNPKPKSFPKILCPDCKLEYSDTKTPRILKACGHTVCEGCADNQIKWNKYISCPTCWTVMVVKGPASTLVKNYTLLDAIHEMRNIN